MLRRFFSHKSCNTIFLFSQIEEENVVIPSIMDRKPTAAHHIPAMGAISSSRRTLHTPPGGFEDPLPPSFGRQSGKGKISSANLRKKQIAFKNTKKNRKKLSIPSSAKIAKELKNRKKEENTIDVVRKELENLIKRNQVVRSRQDEERKQESEELERKSSVNNSHKKEIRFEDSPKQQFTTVEKNISEDDQDNTFEVANKMATSASPASTLMDKFFKEETAANSAQPYPTETSTSLALSPHHNSNENDAKKRQNSSWDFEQKLERHYSVKPSSTVFGSDLDRLEEEMRREFQQHATRLAPLDPVYSQFGAGVHGRRMRWEPSSSFDKFSVEDMKANYRNEKIVGVQGNRNVAAYHMEAEAYREKTMNASSTSERPQHKSMNLVKARQMSEEATVDESVISSNNEQNAEDLEENPHFPSEQEDLQVHMRDADAEPGAGVDSYEYYFDKERLIEVNANRDYRSRITLSKEEKKDQDLFYDAYLQRAPDNRLVELRGADYWASYENRRKLEDQEAVKEQRVKEEILREGAMDTSEVEYSLNRVRKEAFLYFKTHPINEMIQEPFVRIRQILPKDGSPALVYSPTAQQEYEEGPAPSSLQKALSLLNADVDIPLQEARLMAQNLGLDLIRTGSIHTQKSDRRIIALCTIADHREHLRDMMRFKIQKLEVQPPPTKECIEVLFRGGTHPHGIRFKSIGIAKHLLHRHAVRINLMKFGTTREGFPVLQSILDEVKKQCVRLKAFHTVGEIQANYNEIFCYLYPSTGRSPKTTVEHPTRAKLLEDQQFYTNQNEKEIFFDDLQSKVTQKERLQYMLKIENGLAWAEKDEGLSLQKQRAIKVRLGYLPKGNHELYAARGDVNIPAPFRSSHPTSTERWSHPRESNLEQASRGAAALGKRASMNISEMHDLGETPENPTQLDRFYYKVQGPALEVGELKEAFGLKDNRKKQPPLAPGFATLGLDGDSTQGPGFATK